MSSGLRSSPLLHEAAPANSASRRVADENECAKSRLLDQKFNIRNYPDPLQPRQKDSSRAYPPGVTLEMEKRWLRVLQSSKELSRGEV